MIHGQREEGRQRAQYGQGEGGFGYGDKRVCMEYLCGRMIMRAFQWLPTWRHDTWREVFLERGGSTCIVAAVA
jgi:hypothetical protein